jgi:plasmid rolling circle replication initiator protein Rep
MKILKYTYQHRNDFCAILLCEHCEHQQELNSGYNDHYYHNQVLPAIECKTCGKSRTPQASAEDKL